MHRKRSAIGIDLGDHAIKCVQLERHQDQLSVREARYLEVEEAGPEPRDRRQQTLAAARRILKRGDFRGAECLSCLRLFETTTRHVRIPVREIPQAAEVLARELSEQDSKTPGLAFQFQPVAELMDHSERQSEYLCCIADPGLIDDHLAMLDDLGLRAVALDLDACAQVRPFFGPARGEEGPISLCVDLGSRCARLVIVRGSRPVLMRTVPVGGAGLLQTLQQQLQLDFPAIRDLATAGRHSSPEDSEDLKAAITQTLSEQLDVLVGRVFECVRYAGSLYGGQSVTSLRVLGGAAALPGVVDYLARNVDIPAQDNDPFRALDLEPPATVRSVEPAAFSTAVGLAMRGLAS